MNSYLSACNEFIEYYKDLTNKPCYKTLPDLTGLNIHQVDNIVATFCMNLLMSAKQKDRDALFTKYSSLISKARREFMSELVPLSGGNDDE